MTYWPVYPPNIPPVPWPWELRPVYDLFYDVGRIAIYLINAIFGNELLP